MKHLLKHLIIMALLPIISYGQTENCMEVGTNFHFFDAGVFKDLKLSSSHFYTRNHTYMDDENDWDSGLAGSMDQDENGYPTTIPFPHPVTGVDQIVAFTIGGHSSNYETGDYVLLYDGEGTFEFASWTDATVTSTSPGRIEFNVSAVNENGVHIHINTSNPDNHIRNIRIVQEIYEADFETAPYLPQFTEKADAFTALRFMDWTFTNNHPIVEWEDRKAPGFHTQSTEPTGMAWEHIVALCNYMQKDIWINVPHLASENYIMEMAQIFRDELDDSLKIYLEYSNEAWNWIFEQTHWLNETGPFAGEIGRNYGYYSNRAFEIWETQFTGETNRIYTVLAGHDYFVLDAMDYMTEMETIDLVDYVSYPGYVALNEDNYDALDALGASATADDVMDMLEANRASNYYWMHQFKELCSDPYNKPFIMYEGGQHITPRYFGLEAPYNPALYAAQSSERMGTFYTEMLDYYKDSLEVALFMNYVLASEQDSPFGSWGLIENYFVEAPYSEKWNAVMNWIAEHPCGETGSIEPSPSAYFSLYPNPTNGALTLQLNQPIEHVEIVIYNVLGERISTPINKQGNRFEFELPGSTGLYLITIIENGTILETLKVQKH